MIGVSAHNGYATGLGHDTTGDFARIVEKQRFAGPCDIPFRTAVDQDGVMRGHYFSIAEIEMRVTFGAEGVGGVCRILCKRTVHRRRKLAYP